MFEQAFKNIDDVLWKDAGCTSELDYTEQSSWLLFLKYLDTLESDKATEAALDGKKYSHILDKPYRWETWAAPKVKDPSAGSGNGLSKNGAQDLSRSQVTDPSAGSGNGLSKNGAQDL
ncbi:MAG: type I restriction-modification system subunit M N-terminal domain-containing protein, partial [Planctomycetota bacterium]